MATVTRVTTWIDGQILTASALNGEFNNLLNALAIVNADISAGANIALSKINTGISSGLVGLTDVQVLTNKSIKRRVQNQTSVAIVVPVAEDDDVVCMTAQAQNLTIANHFGGDDALDKQLMEFEIKDNGSARTLTWESDWIAGGTALPTTTVPSKILTILFQYSTANGLNKWRCIASVQEI